MKKYHFLWMILVFTFGCYPGGPEFVEELDVVYTNYDPDFDFSATYTYSLPPGVIEITDEDPDGSPEYIDDKFGDPILDGIRENLNALGWEEVDESENPDLIILASAFESTFLFYYDPGWWWWYYPGWGPGWGWWYPGYPPGYVSGYSTGTVLLQMTDPDGLEDNELPVHWTGAFNGLLQGSDANIISRIEFNVDQAFTQDPF